MKKLVFNIVSVVLYLLLSQQYLLSQAPSPAECMTAIFSIEKSDESWEERIKKLQHLEQLLVNQNTTYDSVRARLWHRFGNYYIKLNKIDEGIRFTRKAIAINPKNSPSQKSLLTDSYYNLAGCYKELNLYKQSHAYYDSCIYLGSALNEYNEAILWAMEKKADMYFLTGDYEESIVSASKGILIAQREMDRMREANLLFQKVQAHLAMNQNDKAEESIKLALPIFVQQKMPPVLLANWYSSYASVLMTKGDGTNAMLYYRKALKIHLNSKEWLQCSRDMMLIGIVYHVVLHDVPSALKAYETALQLIRKAGDVVELAGVYNNIGQVHWQNKSYRQALAFYQRALNTLPIGFKDTSIYSNPGPDVMKLINNDYSILTFLSNKGDCLLDLYRTEKNDLLLSNALKTYKAADRAVDQMRYNQYNDTSKLFWRGETKKMYENAIEACYLSNDLKTAFYFFEKSRAVLLSDKLNEIGAKRNLPDRENVKQKQFHDQFFSLQRRFSAMQKGSPLYNETLRELLTVQENRKNFIKSLETRYPVYYQYKYENRVSIDSVYKGLFQNNQSLVEFFTGDSTLYILSLSKGRSKLLKVPMSAYRDTSAELLRLCTDRSYLNQHYERYRDLAFGLYRVLFQPLEVPKGRVVISPDEHFIPFEALLSDSKDGRSFLVKNYAFSYTYSAGFLYQNNVASQNTENTFLGIAPINYNISLNQEALEAADNSLEEIKKYYRSAFFLTHDSATRQQFTTRFPFYKIVQLYTHADSDGPGNEPVLYLTDSVIYLSEIQNLSNINTDLIVLSACNTGVGKSARGEGVFSLARAFSALGIPSMLTTLWKIDNRTTYTLTELFYKNLSKGLTKDVALQKAKLEFLRNSDKEYGLPYFWAATIVLGKTNSFAAEKNGTSYGYYIAAFALIVFAVLFLHFFRKGKSSPVRGKL